MNPDSPAPDSKVPTLNPEVRAKASRHTAATQLIADGNDVRTVAGVLGHESANITKMERIASDG